LFMNNSDIKHIFRNFMIY